MARVIPMQRSDIPELAGVFGAAEAGMGFVPNSMLTMATALDWQIDKHG